MITYLLLCVLQEPLAPVETLNVNEALWGENVPNVLKGIPVAYDAKRDRVYTAGITSGYLAITDPAKGRPIAAIDLEIGGFNVATLHLDSERDRLFYVTHNAGAVRMVDLARGRLAARRDPRGTASGRDRYPVKAAAVDPATGILYVANSADGTVTALDGETLAVVGIHREAQAPFDVAWDPEGKRLLVLDILSKRESRLLSRAESKWTVVRKFGPEFGPRPPRRIAAGCGMVFAQADELYALSSEGKILWSAPLDDAPHAILPFNGRVAVVCRDATSVVLLDARDGKRTGRCVVGYEPSWGSPDEKGDRLFVGNGGDGSVSVVDAKTGRETARYDVANSAEQIAIDPRTGRRFLLNRLGGSEIYVWEKGSKELRILKAGGWPVDMELDAAARRLYVLNHYESSIYAFDVDSLEGLGSFSLGVQGCRTDTLSDFAIDPNSGLSAAAFPERDCVVVVDLAKRIALHTWKPSGFHAGPDVGPGKLHVGIDGARKRIVAYAPPGELWSFDVAAGREENHLELPRVRKQGKSYAIDLLYVWPERDLCFAGASVVDLRSFTFRATAGGVDKIIGVSGDRLFGAAVSRDGWESLVDLDPRDFGTRSTHVLLRTESIRCQQRIDSSQNRLYVADMARASVSVFELPK